MIFKDPGGPAQLGIRDWAGLKGHGADRDLARYAGQKRAAPGEANSHVHRHRVQKVGSGWIIIQINSNNGSNAIRCKGMSH
jgi:hypothetical protein